MRCFHWWRVVHDLALCIHKWSSTSQICSVPLFNTSERWSSLSKQYSQQSELTWANHHRFHWSRDSKYPQQTRKQTRYLIHIVTTTELTCLHFNEEVSRADLGRGVGYSITRDLFSHYRHWSPSIALSREETAGVSTDTFTLSLMTNWITAMTGKLAEKLPLTMSSLINTIPDSLYPEEDIPTSMNIFTSTDSISHYSQMNQGKDETLLESQSYGFVFHGCRAVCVVHSTLKRQQLSPSAARFSGTCFAHFYALYKRSSGTYLCCHKITLSWLRKHYY